MNIIGGCFWVCDKCNSRTFEELFACPKCGGRLSAGWCKGDELHWPEKEGLTKDETSAIIEDTDDEEEDL